MRILVIGEAHPLSSANACSRVFREFGCEVLQFDNKKPSPLFGMQSWWRLGRAGRAAYDLRASWNFLTAAKRFRPDLIFTQKGENIHSRAIRMALEAAGSRLAVWYADNPFHADVTTMNVLRNLRRCDIFYAYALFMVDALKSAGCRRVEYLPFAFDPVTHPPETPINPSEAGTYESKVCFVGTWDRERERLLTELADLKPAIWGQYWDTHLAANSPLRSLVRGGTVWGPEMVKCFKASRVVLNLLRGFNHTSHNFRTMEATGIGGGVLLTPRTIEQASGLFEEGRHLLCYDSASEARTKVFEAENAAGVLEKMAAEAQKRVFDRHLLTHRIQQVIADFD